MDTAPREEDLAALIQRVMAEKRLTQAAVARASGIPLSTINAWVTRRRGNGGRVDATALRALATGLGLPPAQVFTAAGRRPPGPLDEEREAKLLKLYRALSIEGQRALIQTAEVLARTPRAS